MTEQFGAIPVRAFADTRLSAADFRVMGAIAYFDRLGRNGAGCYVDPDKLAAIASVLYQHLSRHTKRLREFGYLEIYRSGTDRRRRIYALIYNEDRAVVTNSGDNLGEDEGRDAKAASRDEKVTTSGDNPAEKVTNASSQAVDPPKKFFTKRLSEANIRDPAKPRARDGENRSHAGTGLPTNHARQGDRGGGNSRAQGHLMLPIQGGNKPPTKQASAADWPDHAKWLERVLRLEKGTGLAEIDVILERMKDERGITYTEATAILDREFKRRRKAAA